MDYFETRERLRARYIAPTAPAAEPRGEVLGEGRGFLTEVAGRVILTAPASTITTADELPRELAARWEQASNGNPYMLWLQGRFVEAEKANRNGAFWSTEDLQFGEMSVRHGPLNWLHDEQTIIGTIADNALIRPEAQPQMAGATNTANTASLFNIAQPRPYIAAVSAVWRWINPEKAEQVERAAEVGNLYYSMECVAREMACVSDETREGCGESFDYITAMTQPDKVCAHIQARSSARRMVDPAFLGGAVIVPPVRPGWGAANVELVKQAANLAGQTEAAAGDMSEERWTALMAEVMRFAAT